MKTCCICGIVKPLSEYYNHKSTKDGKRTECKSCTKKQATGSSRKINTGCTPKQYDELYTKQNGCCAICGAHESEQSKALSADHCHKTQIVRGLLCMSCNTGLGFFKDNKKFLLEAISYLERNTHGSGENGLCSST